MILRSVELKHFGKFSERTFDFRRGMNLVVGPNEAGKSTLMEAIPAVLFGVRNKERFRPWGRQGSCQAALVLEESKRSLRIERDMLTDRVLLVERNDLYEVEYSFEGRVSPQGRSSERAEYLQQLVRLFGVADEDIFRASLFFGQGSLEVSAESGMASKIKTLLSGFVEVDYDKVLGSLSEDYFAITRSNPWGKDKTRERELDEIGKRLQAVEGRWRGAQDGLKELQELRQRSQILSQGIERDREQFTRGERYLGWVRRQWQYLQREQALQKDELRLQRQQQKIEQLQQQRSGLRAELDRLGLPHQVPDDLPALLQESSSSRRQMVDLQEESALLRELLLGLVDAPWKLSGGLSLLLLGGGGTLAWQKPDLLLPAVTGGAFLISLVWIFHLVRVGRVRAERGRLKGQAQVQEELLERVQGRLDELDARCEQYGVTTGSLEQQRLLKALEQNRQLIDQLREIETSLSVLDDPADLERESAVLGRELAQVRHAMEKERPAKGGKLMPTEDLPEAEVKLQELAESLRTRERELLELARREATLEGELADLAQLEEEGETLLERQQQLTRRKDALAAAIELLAGAVDEFRQTYLERFSEEIGRHLTVATGGRYTQVRLDEDFSLSLRGRGSIWAPVEQFSRGTVDAVYLAIRLALTRHLSSGHRLPLLLDDPLVNFDSHRLAETLNSLEQLGREHQVIFLSHDDGLLRRAAQKRWNVVSLDESKSLPASLSQERTEDVGQLCLL